MVTSAPIRCSFFPTDKQPGSWRCITVVQCKTISCMFTHFSRQTPFIPHSRGKKTFFKQLKVSKLLLLCRAHAAFMSLSRQQQALCFHAAHMQFKLDEHFSINLKTCNFMFLRPALPGVCQIVMWWYQHQLCQQFHSELSSFQMDLKKAQEISPEDKGGLQSSTPSNNPDPLLLELTVQTFHV